MTETAAAPPLFPPYTGNVGTNICPKCFGAEVNTIYVNDTHGWGCEDHRPPQPACCAAEHHHRVCQRCHFVWPEAVAGG